MSKRKSKQKKIKKKYLKRSIKKKNKKKYLKRSIKKKIRGGASIATCDQSNSKSIIEKLREYNFKVYRCLNMDKKSFKRGGLASELKYWLDTNNCYSRIDGSNDNKTVVEWVQGGSRWGKYGPYMSTALYLDKLTSPTLCNPLKITISFQLDNLDLTLADTINNNPNVFYPVYDREWKRCCAPGNNCFIEPNEFNCTTSKKMSFQNAENVGEIVINKCNIGLDQAVIESEGFLEGIPHPKNSGIKSLRGQTLQYLANNYGFYGPIIKNLEEVYINFPKGLKCPGQGCKLDFFEKNPLRRTGQHSIHLGKCLVDNCHCAAPNTLWEYYSKIKANGDLFENLNNIQTNSDKWQFVNF
jgi:hypothetical protein